MAADSRKGKKTAAAPAPTRSYALIGVLALAGVAVLAYLVTRPKSVSIPANVEVLAADTAGFRGYLLGSETAPVEITEYADFQCPACQTFELIQFHAVKRQLIDQGLLRWRYRDFPLAQHRNSRLASHAAACANDQGKYWEVHYAIYHNQATWAGSSSATGIFRDMARQAGVDVAAYDECMESARYAGRIQASLDEGLALGVASTPTFLINGRLYPGVLSSDSIAAMVRQLVPASAP